MISTALVTPSNDRAIITMQRLRTRTQKNTIEIDTRKQYNPTARATSDSQKN
jgi:hypothetical protein